jgi:hypothetical protein
VMSTESGPQLLPTDVMQLLMSIHICIPPFRCRSLTEMKLLLKLIDLTQLGDFSSTISEEPETPPLLGDPQ